MLAALLTATHLHDEIVHYFFDESGDFGFPPDGFDCYVQAAVICPEDYLDDMRQFVEDRHRRWDCTELHATKLPPGHRLRMCRFIADSPLELLAFVTDTDIVDRQAIQRWRLGQAATVRRNLDWYRKQGGQAPDIEKWMDAAMGKAGLPTRISDSEFIQATLFVDVIFAALQKSLFLYADDRWRPSFRDFTFILDGKLPRKLGAGEKFLRDSIVPILGSNARFLLGMPDTWKDADPVHPFIEQFEASGGWSGARGQHVQEDVIDLSGIFENGLRFEPSHEHAGLQIADIVAYVVRYAALNPDDERGQLAYDLIRKKLRYLDGRPLRLVRLSTGGADVSGARYRRLAVG